MENTKTESIRERIKTFEDAVEATGMTLPFSEEQMAVLPKDVVAYMKLRIIAAALNGLTKDTLNEFPMFCEDEYRYYPWFYFVTQKELDKMEEKEKKSLLLGGASAGNGSDAGLVCSYSSIAGTHSSSSFAARLAIKTSDDAEYFGKQFTSIWSDYILAQNNS